MKRIYIARLTRCFGGYVARVVSKAVSLEDYKYLTNPWNWHEHPYTSYYRTRKAADKWANDFNNGVHPLSYYGL